MRTCAGATHQRNLLRLLVSVALASTSLHYTLGFRRRPDPRSGVERNDTSLKPGMLPVSAARKTVVPILQRPLHHHLVPCTPK